MARDYKNSGSSRRRQDHPKVPGWLWMFAGLAIGLFVALLVYLDLRPEGRTDVAEVAKTVNERLSKDEKSREQDKSRPAAEAGKTPSTAAETQKPRFDFYNLLPKMEVVIPEQEIAASSAPGADDQPREKMIYFLQAGSFRSHEDADRLKANLALLGIESLVQRVTVNDSETWHRVRVGPFTSLRDLGKVRNVMRENNMEPMMLKVKA